MVDSFRGFFLRFFKNGGFFSRIECLDAVRAEKLCESGGESPSSPEAAADRNSETKVKNGKV